MVVPNLSEPVGFALAVHGSYEPGEVDVLREHLSADVDFLDIGANIGAFTIPLAGFARRVVAIEASPSVIPFLRWNVELSGKTNVDIVDCAVSAPGIDSVPFYMPPMDRYGMGSSAPQFYVEPVTLAARPVDRILSDCGPGRIAAVKVDVEGFESQVFLGAMDLLRSTPAPFILFEFCDWAEERAFPGRKGWAQQILLDEGYTLWPLSDYLAKSDPLTRPVVSGCHMIVGCRL
jgi:FkbM family methyltransferase